MGDKRNTVVGLEFDEKGNFRLVMSKVVFQTVQEAIRCNKCEEIGDDRVAMVVGSRETIELTRFFAMVDTPPCPIPKPPE